MRDTHRLFAGLLHQRTEKAGVDRGRWYVLRALWQRDALTQIELAAQARINGPNIVTAMYSLGTKGLVERRSHPSDGRQYAVFSAKAGRKQEKGLLPVAIQVNEMAPSGLTETEVQTLLGLLYRIRGNLVKFLGGASA